ncbi:ABC transporter permease [Marinobacterium rhizophilum]|uniref:ABC transporter permease n=1 Tax=Marinobacterium rhizophilum TaxID=420402 RepID=A0ABY5HL24_9GAMM|nr:ABC transporter permease [Marinobacterium rhizophilum]UTW13093.1 ABC transporter permease [Marinobacterium rhizophilum]
MQTATLVTPAAVPVERRFLNSRQRLGVGLLLALALLGFGLPLISELDPARQNLSQILAAPSLAEPLGTDHLGRSMLARMASAVQLSLGLALLGVVTAAVPGVLLGVLAGWRGGWVDRSLGVLADTLLALPGLLLVLLLVAIAPGSFWALYVGIALVLWIEYFRVVRLTTVRLMASPQIEASRLLGFGPAYILRRHLWPALAPVVLTLGAFGAATAILAIAALGFVSVGLRPPTTELGLMMTELLPYYHDAPWVLLQPIVAVFLLVLALNLLAGGRKP